MPVHEPIETLFALSKRDKLNLQQRRRIHGKKLQYETSADAQSSLSSGWVVSRFGNKADVYLSADRQVTRCFLRRHLGHPVSGDRVLVSQQQNNYCIEKLLPRQSVITRPSQHGGVKPIAANISHVLIVVAPLPEFSSALLDRYLVAVENSGLNCSIVLNKCDLDDEISKQAIDSQLQIYPELGYEVIRASCNTGQGIAAIQNVLIQNNSVLVGQSGVGKTSLINQLFPEQQEKTNQVAAHSKLGKHTTTRSKLFFMPDNEHFVIDSPGVREFALWHLTEADIVSGFREFKRYLGSCRFRDCNHQNTPGCALEQAAKEGAIAPQRWENFQRIRQSLKVG